MRQILHLTIIQKLVLCVGIFTSLLLVLYPPWIVSIGFEGEDTPPQFFIGRAFIGYHPLLTGSQIRNLLTHLTKVETYKPDFDEGELEIRVIRAYLEAHAKGVFNTEGKGQIALRILEKQLAQRPVVLEHPDFGFYRLLIESATYHVHRGRQIVEPLLCLAFTLALLWVLKTPIARRETEDNA